MSTWNVGPWQSYENNYYYWRTPLKRAKTYIEGAFTEVSNETVNVTLGSETPNLPTQKCRESFTAL